MSQHTILIGIKQMGGRVKPYLRWAILGGTLFFLAKALKDHAREVVALRIDATGWVTLAIALGVTLLAHIWSGWVWSWILRELKQPVTGVWGVQVYLKTNIAKYLPGNVWHFYGRILAAKAAGISVKAATLSVLLEPLLMAAAALAIALIGIQQADAQNRTPEVILQVLSLAAVLIGVHPWILNPVLQFLSKVKGKATGSAPLDDRSFRLERYPLGPLLGELAFLGLRSMGFLLTLLALNSSLPGNIPFLVGAFSFAWLLGLIIPGAPGGIGVFEATALTLLGQSLSPAVVLGTVALYRLVSILAEVAGAGLASLSECGWFNKTS